MFSRITGYKELRYLAYHDSLTGLLNRNWLYKNIDKIDYAFVYFIDINDLHKINEQGHTFGDKHIQKVVQSIQFMYDGVLVRYAGDEFILLSNQMYNGIKTNDLYSIGFSVIEQDVMVGINRADKEMIRNKQIWKTGKL